MQRVYRMTQLVARRDTTVLILGQSGTGKDLVAQAIHNLSPRRANPFVVINCAAIPEALLEAELFGYTKGAFTGAVQSRIGRIHAAQGGTLFLDEIGDLPLGLQSKLLRFLEQGEVQRLGSTEVSKSTSGSWRQPTDTSASWFRKSSSAKIFTIAWQFFPSSCRCSGITWKICRSWQQVSSAGSVQTGCR